MSRLKRVNRQKRFCIRIIEKENGVETVRLRIDQLQQERNRSNEYLCN